MQGMDVSKGEYYIAYKYYDNGKCWYYEYFNTTKEWHDRLEELNNNDSVMIRDFGKTHPEWSGDTFNMSHW